jgi:TRAP-type C4-dicarboxylate transport system permease small subunit
VSPIRAAFGRPKPTWRRVGDQFEEIVACVALAAVVLAVSWGVITRYITAQPAAWASEVATLAFAWVVFFGAAACIKYRLHPSIDMVVRRLPRPLGLAVRSLNHALVLGFCAFMAWFGTRFAIDAWSNPSPVLRLPLTWLYGPVAFCFALMALRYLQVLQRGPWTIDADRETNVG